MPKRKRRDDTTSLILGIMSLVLSLIVALAGTICAIAGLIFGARTRKESSIGRAGFVCSLIGLILNVTIWIIGAWQASIAMQAGTLTF